MEFEFKDLNKMKNTKMSEIDICEIKKKNYKSVKLDKFPSSGGIFPDMEFEDNHLNKNEKYNNE